MASGNVGVDFVATPSLDRESDIRVGNCDPRLPAEHFKVKKESKNQGRWCKVLVVLGKVT